MSYLEILSTRLRKSPYTPEQLKAKSKLAKKEILYHKRHNSGIIE